MASSSLSCGTVRKFFRSMRSFLTETSSVVAIGLSFLFRGNTADLEPKDNEIVVCPSLTLCSLDNPLILTSGVHNKSFRMRRKRWRWLPPPLASYGGAGATLGQM